MKITLNDGTVELTKDILQHLLTESMTFRGMKDDYGRPILRYAFLKKKHLKRVAWQKCYKLKDGRNFYVRVFK